MKMYGSLLRSTGNYFPFIILLTAYGRYLTDRKTDTTAGVSVADIKNDIQQPCYDRKHYTEQQCAPKTVHLETTHQITAYQYYYGVYYKQEEPEGKYGDRKRQELQYRFYQSVKQSEDYCNQNSCPETFYVNSGQ